MKVQTRILFACLSFNFFVASTSLHAASKAKPAKSVGAIYSEILDELVSDTFRAAVDQGKLESGIPVIAILETMRTFPIDPDIRLKLTRDAATNKPLVRALISQRMLKIIEAVAEQSKKRLDSSFKSR